MSGIEFLLSLSVGHSVVPLTSLTQCCSQTNIIAMEIPVTFGIIRGSINSTDYDLLHPGKSRTGMHRLHSITADSRDPESERAREREGGGAEGKSK